MGGGRGAHCAWRRSTEGTSRRCGQRRIDCPPKIGNVLQIAPSACRPHAALQCEPQKRCARARADDKPAQKIERAIGKRIGEADAGASQRIGPRRVSRATSPMHSNRSSDPLQSIDDWSERGIRRRLTNGRQREALFIDMQRIDTALHRLNDGDFPAATKTSLGEARLQAPLASFSRYRASGYSTLGRGVESASRFHSFRHNPTQEGVERCSANGFGHLSH